MHEGIRDVEVTRLPDGTISAVRLVFGPHYFVDLSLQDDAAVQFVLGFTHHGFVADASEVSGELEQIINETRVNHPDRAVD